MIMGLSSSAKTETEKSMAKQEKAISIANTRDRDLKRVLDFMMNTSQDVFVHILP
jgi:hypothetical protein